MKRSIFSLVCILLVMFMVISGTIGCSERRAPSYSTGSVKDVVEQGMVAQGKGEAELAEPGRENSLTENENKSGTSASVQLPGYRESYDKVDVDLTVLSATMVYSEVYDMMVYPEKYIGKTVKMDGTFSLYHDKETGNNYFACLIQDATACCAQGIEFELTDDYKYPDDYPGVNEDICVVGVFDTYMEGNDRYCTLRKVKLL
ncbi:MAG: hypothetical protein K6A39_05360 [Clostridiales bacterium]|nr:hypothetical protein [Clostridiales bacterium]